MVSVEELFASAGVSIGAYTIYKIAFRIYQKYYLSSECSHPTPTTTDIIVHISEAEQKEAPNIEVVVREEPKR